MSQIVEMKVFVKIVEAGTISRAAEQLGLAKSAVSRRLADLERRLGVQLLSRTTRTSSLTEAGQSYYQRAGVILDELAELDADISSKKGSLEGVLNIAAPFSFGLRHLSGAIDEFTRRHDKLVINLNFSDRQSDLIEEGFDLAIRITELKDSSLIARKIAPVRLLLCASPDYLEIHGRPDSLQDLKQHAGLYYTYAPGTSWKLTDKNGREEAVKLPVKMIANNGDFLQDMAVAGQGLAVLPSFIAAENIRAGKLETLLPDFEFRPLNAFLIYPQTRHLARRVRTFIDFLTERFAGEPYWDKGLNVGGGRNDGSILS